MARKVGVSRHGLTRCPGCRQHIKVAARLEATICPFCRTSLAVEPVPAGVLGAIRAAGQQLMRSRGGLLTAALLAPTPLFLGCESSASGGKPDAAGVVDSGDASDGADAADGPDASLVDVPVPDASPQPEYGVPPLDIEELDDPGGPQPLYGLPSDVITPIDDDTGPGPQPLYGLPPLDVTTLEEIEEDAGPGPQPLYGVPPFDAFTPADKDASDDTSDIDEDDVDSNPVPLYGLPPEPS